MAHLQIVGQLERTVSGGMRLKFTTKETAQLIRQALRQAFPGVTFSVITKYGSCYSATNVRWTDGPTQPEVERVTNRFSSKSFDGMTDSTNYHEQIVDGQRVSYSGWVNVTREVSEVLRARAYARVCRQFGIDPRPDGQSWNDYRPARGNDTIGDLTGRMIQAMRPNGCLVTLKGN